MSDRRLRIWFQPLGEWGSFGFWWFGHKQRAMVGFIVKPPWSQALPSERFGWRVPVIKFCGWRVFGPPS